MDTCDGGYWLCNLWIAYAVVMSAWAIPALLVSLAIWIIQNKDAFQWAWPFVKYEQLSANIPTVFYVFGIFILILLFLWGPYVQIKQLKTRNESLEETIATMTVELTTAKTRIHEVEAAIVELQDANADLARGNEFEKGPATFLQYNLSRLREFPILQPDKHTRINFIVTNVGPKIAHDVSNHVDLITLAEPVNAASEEKMYTEFKLRKHEKFFTDLIPGGRKFVTVNSRQLSQQDILDIKDGRVRLYMVGQIQYRDVTGMHKIEACEYLLPPGNTFTWKDCDQHNIVK